LRIREREMRALADLVVGVRDRGAALVVRGDAGIGKSTLVTAASDRARAEGTVVLTATGVRSETHRPFAALHQLVRPILGAAEGLPPRQREALLGAFGMSEAGALDTFLIALAALELLADVAGDAPLLVVMEDAQWLDRPTADVLAFVARRLELEPIALLVAVREGYETPLTRLGLPELRVGALDDEASAALLDAHAPDLTPALRAAARRGRRESAGAGRAPTIPGRDQPSRLDRHGADAHHRAART
jgi:predicted ATPase